MDPLTLMLLFGAGSAIFGAATSFGTSAYNNAQAADMSEQAMQQQLDNQLILNAHSQAFSNQQLQKQQQFAWDMWNANNSYNSQAAIDQRLREAGRNPYLANNSNVASVSTSPGSFSQASSGNAALANPQFSPVQGIAQLFENSGIKSSQMLSYLEDIKGKKIDNMFRGAEAIANLKKLGVDIEEKQLRNYMQRITNMFAQDMQEQDLLSKMETNKNLRLQGQSLGYTIAAQAVQNAYLPQQLKLDVAMKNAQLYTEFQRGKLTMSQYKHELIKALMTKENVKGAKLDNEGKQISNYRSTLDYSTASEIAGYIVRKALAEAETMENNKYPRDWWQSTYNKKEYPNIGGVPRTIGTLTGSVGNFFGK